MRTKFEVPSFTSVHLFQRYDSVTLVYCCYQQVYDIF